MPVFFGVDRESIAEGTFLANAFDRHHDQTRWHDSGLHRNAVASTDVTSRHAAHVEPGEGGRSRHARRAEFHGYRRLPAIESSIARRVEEPLYLQQRLQALPGRVNGTSYAAWWGPSGSNAPIFHSAIPSHAPLGVNELDPDGDDDHHPSIGGILGIGPSELVLPWNHFNDEFINPFWRHPSLTTWHTRLVDYAFFLLWRYRSFIEDFYDLPEIAGDGSCVIKFITPVSGYSGGVVGGVTIKEEVKPITTNATAWPGFTTIELNSLFLDAVETDVYTPLSGDGAFCALGWLASVLLHEISHVCAETERHAYLLGNYWLYAFQQKLGVSGYGCCGCILASNDPEDYATGDDVKSALTAAGGGIATAIETSVGYVLGTCD